MTAKETAAPPSQSGSSRRTGRRGVSARQGYALAVMVIIAATLAIRSYGLLVSPIDADEGVYLVVAQQWLRGGLPYVAVWDQHPPGLPALFAILQTLIFDPVLGARLAAAAAVATTAVLMHRFCVRYANQPGAGLVAALLYIVCISRWAGLSANTEVFNNACTALAAYLLFGAIRRSPDLRTAVTVAVVFGVGLQIKYVIFPEAVLLSLGYLIVSYRRSGNARAAVVAAGLMIAGGCLPTALTTAYFWFRGALWPFLDANIGSNITYIGIVPPLADILRDSASGVLPIVGPALIMAYAMLERVRWRRPWCGFSSMEAWILLWLVAAVLNVCLPMKFFRHHFFALYPPVCLGGALALAAVAVDRRKSALGIVVLLITAVPAWAMGVVRASPWAEVDVPRAIAKLVREAGARDADLYVYRYHPTVYALARLRPPTPYVMTLELSEFSESAHVDGITELRRVMEARPRFVIRPISVHDAWVTGAADDQMTRSLSNYRLIREFVDAADRSVIGVYER
jgi:4-amino-4-deoxy-L-arabinose transferase-like glycosyltransferase